MTFTIEVERILSRDAVGATHAATAWRQVDVSRTHWEKKKVDSSVSDQSRYKLKKKTKKSYRGWSSGVFLHLCRRLQEETVGTGYLCPEGPLLSETSATPFLPRGTSGETTEGT